MHVHDLDELSLLTIFDYLPICDLLIAGQVCTRWNVFRAKSGLTRRSLTLLLGGVKTREYVGNSLFVIPRYWYLKNDDGSRIYPSGTYAKDLNKRIVLMVHGSVNLDFSNFLVELFPGIANFVVGMIAQTGHILNQITYILRQWSPSLVSLNIAANKMVHQPTVDTRLRLLQAVNELNSLVRLEFDINFRVLKDFKQDGSIRIDLPILARLEHFNFYTGDESDYIFDSLKQYGDSNRRLKIGLQSPVHDIDKFITLSPELSTRFYRLEVLLHWFNIESLISLTDRFTNLISLSLILDSQSLDQFDVERQLVFGPLVPLTQLVDLTLTIYGRVLESLQKYDDERQEDYAQLKSIKVFTLSINPPQLTTHDIFWELDFGWLFPNLQVARFRRAEQLCAQCVLDGYNVRDDYENYCLKTMIEPFRECAQLQLVSTNHPAVEWSPEDLQDELEEEEEDEEVEEDYYDEQSDFNDEDCKLIEKK